MQFKGDVKVSYLSITATWLQLRLHHHQQYLTVIFCNIKNCDPYLLTLTLCWDVFCFDWVMCAMNYVWYIWLYICFLIFNKKEKQNRRISDLRWYYGRRWWHLYTRWNHYYQKKTCEQKKDWKLESLLVHSWYVIISFCSFRFVEIETLFCEFAWCIWMFVYQWSIADQRK